MPVHNQVSRGEKLIERGRIAGEIIQPEQAIVEVGPALLLSHGRQPARDIGLSGVIPPMAQVIFDPKRGRTALCQNQRRSRHTYSPTVGLFAIHFHDDELAQYLLERGDAVAEESDSFLTEPAQIGRQVIGLTMVGIGGIATQKLLPGVQVLILTQ